MNETADKTEPTRVAWATRSASNGLITRWSLYHLSRDLTCQGGTALCGTRIPHSKMEIGHRKSPFIKSGNCQACLAALHEIKSHQEKE